MKIKRFHISRTIKFIVISLILLGCTNQGTTTNNLKKGDYAFKEQNKLTTKYYGFFHNAWFNLGDTLTINDSVNFTYVNCSEYGFGKYRISKDSLYLTFDSSASFRDSIMHYNKNLYTYFIEDSNTLIREYKGRFSKEGEDKINIISKLYFVEDKIIKQN